MQFAVVPAVHARNGQRFDRDANLSRHVEHLTARRQHAHAGTAASTSSTTRRTSASSALARIEHEDRLRIAQALDHTIQLIAAPCVDGTSRAGASRRAARPRGRGRRTRCRQRCRAEAAARPPGRCGSFRRPAARSASRRGARRARRRPGRSSASRPTNEVAARGRLPRRTGTTGAAAIAGSCARIASCRAAKLRARLESETRRRGRAAPRGRHRARPPGGHCGRGRASAAPRAARGTGSRPAPREARGRPRGARRAPAPRRTAPRGRRCAARRAGAPRHRTRLHR